MDDLYLVINAFGDEVYGPASFEDCSLWHTQHASLGRTYFIVPEGVDLDDLP